jgi:hypothetical protein
MIHTDGTPTICTPTGPGSGGVSYSTRDQREVYRTPSKPEKPRDDALTYTILVMDGVVRQRHMVWGEANSVDNLAKYAKAYPEARLSIRVGKLGAERARYLVEPGDAWIYRIDGSGVPATYRRVV